MIKSRRKILILLSVVVLIFGMATLFFVRYKQINKKYPQAKVKSFSIGAPVIYKSFKYTVKDCRMATPDDLRQMIDYDAYLKETNDTDESDDSVKYLLVTLTVKDIGLSNDIAAKDSITMPYAESKVWYNGYGLYLMKDLNKDSDTTLAHNEEKTFVLPYAIHETQFRPEDWKKITSREFDLIR